MIGLAESSPAYFIDTEPVIYAPRPTLQFVTIGKWNYVQRYNPLSITLYFGCDSLPSSIYITVSNGNIPSYYPKQPMDIFISSDPALLIPQDIESFTYQEFAGRTLPWFDFYCGDDLIRQRPCSSLIWASNQQPMTPPCDDTVIIHPVPLDYLIFWNFPPVGALKMYPSFPQQPLEGASFSKRSLALSKLISTLSTEGTFVPYSSYDLSTCQLQFKSTELFWKDSKIAVNATVKPQTYQGVCTDNFTDYQQHISQYVDAVENYNHANSSTSNYWQWVSGEGGFDWRFKSCVDFMDGLFEFSTVNTSEISNQCLIPNIYDPCCNLTYSWTQCCTYKSVELTVEQRGSLLSNQIQGICGSDTSCGNILAQEYATIAVDDRCFQENPSLTQITFSELKGWRSCLSDIFRNSSASFIIPCSSDDDCLEPFRNLSFRCDLVSHTCLSNYPCCSNPLSSVWSNEHLSRFFPFSP